MKLKELFPEMPILKLGGKEYELKYTVRSKLQFEIDYPDDQDISTADRVIAAINSVFTGMKTSDVVNFLYAGLIHTGDFTSKEILINLMEVNKINVYMDNIFCAYKLSTYTDEQLEKMQVMAKANGAIKKKKAAAETMPANTPSLEPNAD